MNFLCDRCKQKYHVADEKVRGRAVTRFKCKKCEHVIELRLAGDGMPAGALPDEPGGASETPASIPPPASTASAAASRANSLPHRPPTSTGLPSAPRPPTSAGLPSAPRPATSTGLPTSPRPTASALPSLGARPNPPTAAPLPSRAAIPPAAGNAAPRRASIPPSPLLSGASRPGTATGLPVAGAPRPGVPRAATGTALSTAAARTATASSPSPLRSGLASKSTTEPAQRSTAASALLNAGETGWYAGVRDLPLGPLTRGELASRIESGDITPDSLVWREGLDDWRPLRNVDELADLMRAAAQKMSDGLLGTMSRREPAAGKIVPIAHGRAGAPKEQNAFEEDEPTRMTALSELITKAEERGLLSPLTSSGSHSPPSATASSKPAPTSSAPSSNMLPVSTVTATASAKPAPAPAPSASPAVPPATSAASIAGPNEQTFNIDPATVGFTMGNATPLATTPSAPAASAAPAQNDRRGLPIGVWIMMAGVLVAGVAVGLVLRPSAPGPTPVTAPPQSAHMAPTPPIEPSTRQVGAEIHLGPDTPPVAVAVAVAPTPVPPTVEPAHRVASVGAPHASTAPAATSGAARPGGGLNAAQLAALNAQLGSQGAGVAQSTGPTNTQLRTVTQAQDNNGGLSGEARAGQVIAAFRRANVVDNCWTAAQRRNPAHPGESIHVGIDVSPNGRASGVRVTGAQDPDLVNCIQTRTRAQPYGAGGSVSTEVSFNLVPGQ